MKKFVFLLLQLTTINIWSQTHHNELPVNNSLQNFDVVVQISKNLFHTGFRNDINVRAMRHFIRSFENATEVIWRISENGASVSFYCNNEKITSYYDKRGGHLFTLKTYAETELDPLIARWIKNELGNDFSIYQVTEEIRGNDTLYEITLENCMYWCIVQLQKKGYNAPEKLSEYVMSLKG